MTLYLLESYSNSIAYAAVDTYLGGYTFVTLGRGGANVTLVDAGFLGGRGVEATDRSDQ
jgi:hypothetical protein